MRWDADGGPLLEPRFGGKETVMVEVEFYQREFFPVVQTYIVSNDFVCVVVFTGVVGVVGAEVSWFGSVFERNLWELDWFLIEFQFSSSSSSRFSDGFRRFRFRFGFDCCCCGITTGNIDGRML